MHEDKIGFIEEQSNEIEDVKEEVLHIKNYIKEKFETIQDLNRELEICEKEQTEVETILDDFDVQANKIEDDIDQKDSLIMELQAIVE